MEDRELLAAQEDIMHFYRAYNEKIHRRAMDLYRDTFTHGQFLVLSILHAAGSMSLSDLAERATMQKQQITKLVNQLEHGGYVQRVRGQRGGRRVFMLQETPLSHEYYAQLNARSRRWMAQELEVLPPEKREAFLRNLRELSALLEEMP